MRAYVELFQSNPLACTMLTAGLVAAAWFVISLRRMK